MLKPFNQLIKNVQGDTALVESKSGNIYPVMISDYVKMKKTINVGDIAKVIKTNGRYIMVDVEHKPDETKSFLSKIPMEELGYDY